MGRARFKIPDKPADRPKVPEVSELIAEYYDKPGHAAGGNCHVVLDDSNHEDSHITWCLENCVSEGDEDGAAIMRAMLQMTRSQRRRLRW